MDLHRLKVLSGIVVEEVGKNYLFHGTQLFYALCILSDNQIDNGINWRGEGDRVSLTRSYNVALRHIGKEDYIGYDSVPVVFVLDKDKLYYNYKIRPYKDVDSQGNYWEFNEQEENLFGPIKNLDKYLVSINYPTGKIIDIFKNEEYIQTYIEEKLFSSKEDFIKKLNNLLNHPKSNIWKTKFS